jgi:hypothetical protein
MRLFREEPTYGGVWRNSTEETLKISSGTMKWDGGHRRWHVLTTTEQQPNVNTARPILVGISPHAKTGCSSLTIWASRYGRDFPCRVHFPVRYVPLAVQGPIARWTGQDRRLRYHATARYRRGKSAQRFSPGAQGQFPDPHPLPLSNLF